MKQRGRKTTGALAVVEHDVTAIQRIGPPSRLTAEEREIWLTTVNAKPADWFGLEQAVILESYCRHVCLERRTSKVLDKVAQEWEGGADNLTEYARACRMHELETRAVAMLASRMRLTQQSVVDKRTAGLRGEKYVNGRDKPWARAV